MDTKGQCLIGGELHEIEWRGVLREDRSSGYENSRKEINKGKGVEGATRGTGL